MAPDLPLTVAKEEYGTVPEEGVDLDELESAEWVEDDQYQAEAGPRQVSYTFLCLSQLPLFMVLLIYSRHIFYFLHSRELTGIQRFAPTFSAPCFQCLSLSCDSFTICQVELLPVAL